MAHLWKPSLSLLSVSEQSLHKECFVTPPNLSLFIPQTGQRYSLEVVDVGRFGKMPQFKYFFCLFLISAYYCGYQDCLHTTGVSALFKFKITIKNHALGTLQKAALKSSWQQTEQMSQIPHQTEFGCWAAETRCKHNCERLSPIQFLWSTFWENSRHFGENLYFILKCVTLELNVNVNPTALYFWSRASSKGNILFFGR